VLRGDEDQNRYYPIAKRPLRDGIDQRGSGVPLVRKDGVEIPLRYSTGALLACQRSGGERCEDGEEEAGDERDSSYHGSSH
jgi:hypothetical protein